MTASPVPRLETARLLLREWGASDVDPHAAKSADPEVMRYLGGVLGREQSRRRLAPHADTLAGGPVAVFGIERANNIEDRS